MHTLLFFRKEIWRQSRLSMSDQLDIHARLMSRYKQVPDWWYLLIFVITFTIGIITIEVWNTELPVWAFCLALAIALVYAVPIGMIVAITNQPIGLNVITELIIGYALPGRPIAMMMFKTWGFMSMYQSLIFASDLKLSHYMKVPPRTMFCDVLSAALDSGLGLSIVLIFFTLQYPGNGSIGLNTIHKWWGNTVYKNTADAQALPLLPVPASGTF
ncbi:hypothetical protein ID866_9050, partial [Astraeus odoratus]